MSRYIFPFGVSHLNLFSTLHVFSIKLKGLAQTQPQPFQKGKKSAMVCRIWYMFWTIFIFLTRRDLRAWWKVDSVDKMIYSGVESCSCLFWEDLEWLVLVSIGECVIEDEGKYDEIFKWFCMSEHAKSVREVGMHV